MPRPPFTSPGTVALLEVLSGSDGCWYGYDLSRGTGLKSGSLYPLLIRLEREGWLESRWEESPQPGRPPRHMYRITPLGASAVRAAVAELRQRTGHLGAPALGDGI